jgi:hypothetical protein
VRGAARTLPGSRPEIPLAYLAMALTLLQEGAERGEAESLEYIVK